MTDRIEETFDALERARRLVLDTKLPGFYSEATDTDIQDLNITIRHLVCAVNRLQQDNADYLVSAVLGEN